MSSLPRVAVIGTGGTIASQGDSPLELIEYIERKRVKQHRDKLVRYFGSGATASG